MRPSGLAEVEAAKADGRWDAAYEGQRRATVPDDLQAELDRSPAAATFFAELDGANRYAILYRLERGKEARDAGAAPARNSSRCSSAGKRSTEGRGRWLER